MSSTEWQHLRRISINADINLIHVQPKPYMTMTPWMVMIGCTVHVHVHLYVNASYQVSTSRWIQFFQVLQSRRYHDARSKQRHKLYHKKNEGLICQTYMRQMTRTWGQGPLTRRFSWWQIKHQMALLQIRMRCVSIKFWNLWRWARSSPPWAKGFDGVPGKLRVF